MACIAGASVVRTMVSAAIPTMSSATCDDCVPESLAVPRRSPE
jgi:hypothetical protein